MFSSDISWSVVLVSFFDSLSSLFFLPGDPGFIAFSIFDSLAFLSAFFLSSLLGLSGRVSSVGSTGGKGAL